MIRQPSLFGAGASAPSPADLAGLLLAGGEGSATAEGGRIDVVVHDPWRAAAIVFECARRSIPAVVVSTVDSPVGVRTGNVSALRPLVDRWSSDQGRCGPRDLVLDGATLRLWALAAGHREGAGFTLGFVGSDQAFRDHVGAGLAGLGMAAQVVSRRAGAGEVFRILGRRRLTRLAELVGDPPKQAPADTWPS